MPWVCDGVPVAIETCQLKFADFEVKTAILSKVEMDVFKKRERERIALLGICMQLNFVSIHMKI